MGIEDKAKLDAKDVKGKLKEAKGRATGDDAAAAEGKAEQKEASVRKAGEHVKDAFKK